MDAYLSLLDPSPGQSLWCVAFSGGLDSRFLLELCALYRDRHPESVHLRAIHVDHGIHAGSAGWARHCKAICQTLRVPLHVETLSLGGQSANLESRARSARYAVFERQLQPGERLFTGHHRDDQAETVLYRVLNGHGVSGLAGIPGSRALGQGQVARPLLPIGRDDIREVAARLGWNWIEDPSNASLAHTRNRLRHQVLPQAEAAIPGATQRLARLAEHMQEADGALWRFSRQHYQIETTRPYHCLDLQTVSGQDRKMVLRYWLKEFGLVPPESQWPELVGQMLGESVGSAPEVNLCDWSLRRYRQTLYLLSPAWLRWLADKAYQQSCWPWNGSQTLQLPDGRNLQWPPGLTPPLNGEVRFLQGGEKLPLPGGEGHQLVRKTLQSRGVPSWARCLTPVLWVNGAARAVLDYSF